MTIEEAKIKIEALNAIVKNQSEVINRLLLAQPRESQSLWSTVRLGNCWDEKELSESEAEQMNTGYIPMSMITNERQ